MYDRNNLLADVIHMGTMNAKVYWTPCLCGSESRNRPYLWSVFVLFEGRDASLEKVVSCSEKIWHIVGLNIWTNILPTRT